MDDFVKDFGGFEVHAHRGPLMFSGYVYLTTNIVYFREEPLSDFPAGIEDFANWMMKKFSQRLAQAIQRIEDNE